MWLTPGEEEISDWLLCTSTNLHNYHLIDVHSSQSEISSHREHRRFSYIVFHYVTRSTRTSFAIDRLIAIDVLGTPDLDAAFMAFSCSFNWPWCGVILLNVIAVYNAIK